MVDANTRHHLGTAVVAVTYELQNPDDSWDQPAVVSLARMFVARVQQAEQGRTPDASVR
ncbi:hypothetical protein ACFYST_17050 [Kitasatospora sp. NPDC004614]|uniref:hypothetical protein n=1 Tax=unclassified Kitasatospora TaxID=2633591 RepID=UPI00368AA32D